MPVHFSTVITAVGSTRAIDAHLTDPREESIHDAIEIAAALHDVISQIRAGGNSSSCCAGTADCRTCATRTADCRSAAAWRHAHWRSPLGHGATLAVINTVGKRTEHSWPLDL